MARLLSVSALQSALRGGMRPGGGIAAGIGFAHRSTALVSPAAVIAASRSLSLQSAMIAPQRLACAHLRSATAAGARKKSSFTAPPAAGGAIPAQTEPAGEPVETEARANETARVEEVEQEERAGTRAMGWWLIGCSGMVAGMVVLGGVTRLTGSGLSMVKWRPTGIWPPATTELWEKEFEEFKQYPEWIMKRQYENFGLEDFKFIWYMEWSHRMAGRCVGIAFAVPLAYFAARGYVDGALGRRLGLLFCMGGSQGLVGWWMVKSGLQKDKINVEQAEAWQMNTQFASVSPYRLTTHLGSALAIYSLLLWTGLGLLDRRRLATTASSAARRVAWVQRLVMVSTGAAGLTAVSGGFVAGNKAGLAYNDWPFMGYPNLVPDDWWEDALGWRNFFENIPTVQLNHRLLAYTTAAAAAATVATVRRLPLPPRVRRAAHLVGAMVCVQISLGVSTLWFHVPIELAAPHQFGSVMLLTTFLWLLHTLRPAAGGYKVAKLSQAVAKGMRYRA